MAKNKIKDKKNGLSRKQYESELLRLQAELCKLQDWVKYRGLRVIVVFEGRDAAGKGGTIRALTERVSPRVFRVVALPAPSDREKSQMYVQRYVQTFPAAGEIVIFDRSWYNRAGVEYVMGFCSKEEHRRFLELCPLMEKYIVSGGGNSHQVLVGSRPKRAAATFRVTHQGPTPPMEAEPDGPPLLQPLVRIFQSERPHDEGLGHQICSLVYRAL